MKDRSGEMVEGLQASSRLDGLIGVGGDGSLDILRRLLAPTGRSPSSGCPKTIDNDVANTERAVGYSTAVAIATEALDRLQPTGASHERVMVLEVMGRDAGHIAIAAGIAGGADVVLIPEVRWHLEHVVAHIAAPARGRPHLGAGRGGRGGRAVGRGAGCAATRPMHGVGEWLARRLSKATGAEARATVLGHVQRGAMPTAEDRLLASALGVRAVDLLAEGKADRMVAWWNRQVIDVPLEKVVGRSRTVDPRRRADAHGPGAGDLSGRQGLAVIRRSQRSRRSGGPVMLAESTKPRCAVLSAAPLG